MIRRSTSFLSETRLDLRLALPELERAIREVAVIPDEARRDRLAGFMSGPLARLDLVYRTCAVILERHHWRQLKRCGAMRSRETETNQMAFPFWYVVPKSAQGRPESVKRVAHTVIPKSGVPIRPGRVPGRQPPTPGPRTEA